MIRSKKLNKSITAFALAVMLAVTMSPIAAGGSVYADTSKTTAATADTKAAGDSSTTENAKGNNGVPGENSTPPDGAPPDGGVPGGDTSSVTWSGATTFTSAASETGRTYTSTTEDQNAILVDTSSDVSLTNATVTKSGGTSASDNYSFYGINSGIMCKGGGTTTIKNAKIITNAAGANGVFSYGGNASTNATSGDGTTVVISDSEIKTTGDGSGGIMTTGQGIMKASNLTVNTSGRSSAAIRSDRGGGTVTVDGGTYKTTGVGSPAIYATATINVSDATLTSTASQGVVNEGGNTVILKDCTLNASNTTRNSQDKFKNGVFLYQSMSGDASDGASVFSMTDGTLNNTEGHVIHVTNTSAAITLNNVKINNMDSEGVFLSVCDDAWSGLDNAATLNATDQTITGKVLVGNDSTATLNLSGSSAWLGSTSGVIKDADGNSVSTSLGTVNVNLGSGSVWKLTEDCKVTSLSGTGSINYNGHTLTVGSKTYSSGSIGSVTETTSDGTVVDPGNDTAQKSVTFKNTTKTIKASALKKSKKTYSIIKTFDGGTVSYKVTKGKAKYISVSMTGKVTVKKGAKKGTYKVKISVAATSAYKAATKTITIKVK